MKITSIFSLAFCLLLLLGTIRGGATSLAKFVTINDIPAISYAMWQSLTAALLLLTAGYLKTKRLPSFRQAGVHYLFCGIVGAALPNVLFFTAIKNMNAGAMAVILTLGPIFTYTLLLGLGRETVNRFRLIGLVLGLIGGSMIALGSTGSNFSFNVFLPACAALPDLLCQHERLRKLPNVFSSRSISTGRSHTSRVFRGSTARGIDYTANSSNLDCS